MNQTTIEVLSAMYIAPVSAGNMNDRQRALGFLARQRDAPEILWCIASHAVNQEAGFDWQPPRRLRFNGITGGAPWM